MKPRLAFIRRAHMPVVERARQMFDVAYEDRQLPADEALKLVVAHKADAIFFTSTFKFDADFIGALPDHVKVAASASSFLDHADLAAARALFQDHAAEVRRPRIDLDRFRLAQMVGEDIGGLGNR